MTGSLTTIPIVPDVLEDVSFHDFASGYNFVRGVADKNKMPSGTLPLKNDLGYVQARNKPVLDQPQGL